MQSDFLFLYRRLRGKSVSDLIKPDKLQPVEGFFAGILEEGYNVVLRALLDEIEIYQPDGLASNGERVLLENWKLLAEAEEELKKIARNFQARIGDFEKNWKSRFGFSIMFPDLKAGKWIQNQSGEYSIRGQGAKADSRIFYQQTVQDMLVEGMRIFALFGGTLNRFHKKTAATWRRQLKLDNHCKMYMLIEEVLRKKENDLLKNLRIGVSDLFKSLFTHQVRNWSRRRYADEQMLFRHMAWPWYSPGRVESGFEGFMLVFSQFLSELINLLLDISENKWRLFLRGVGRATEASIT